MVPLLFKGHAGVVLRDAAVGVRARGLGVCPNDGWQGAIVLRALEIRLRESANSVQACIRLAVAG